MFVVFLRFLGTPSRIVCVDLEENSCSTNSVFGVPSGSIYVNDSSFVLYVDEGDRGRFFIDGLSCGR